jgi:hypothetical protein
MSFPYYRVGSTYYDTSGGGFYVCTSAGYSAASAQSPTSVWAKVGGGVVWQTPYKELDPTVAVAVGTFVYLSPGNPLVTTGLTDLVSGLVVNAPAGIWQAAQNVPAQVTVSSVVKYNVPQIPYPGASGATPSGTPLKGDLDGANVFWIFLQEYNVCT